MLRTILKKGKSKQTPPETGDTKDDADTKKRPSAGEVWREVWG